MLIDRAGPRRARRLHDEAVRAPDVLVDLERDLGVRKAPQPRLPDRHAQEIGNFPCQIGMRTAGKNLELTEAGGFERIGRHRSVPLRNMSLAPTSWMLAGAEGFEPSNTGSKVPRLTAWPRPNRVWRAHLPTSLRTSCPLTLTVREPLRDEIEGADLRSGSNNAAQTVSVYDAVRMRQARAGRAANTARARASRSRQGDRAGPTSGAMRARPPVPDSGRRTGRKWSTRCPTLPHRPLRASQASPPPSRPRDDARPPPPEGRFRFRSPEWAVRSHRPQGFQKSP